MPLTIKAYGLLGGLLHLWILHSTVSVSSVFSQWLLLSVSILWLHKTGEVRVTTICIEWTPSRQTTCLHHYMAGLFGMRSILLFLNPWCFHKVSFIPSLWPTHPISIGLSFGCSFPIHCVGGRFLCFCMSGQWLAYGRLGRPCYAVSQTWQTLPCYIQHNIKITADCSRAASSVCPGS